jgi:hypothetical protein
MLSYTYLSKGQHADIQWRKGREWVSVSVFRTVHPALELCWDPLSPEGLKYYVASKMSLETALLHICAF